MKTQWSVWCLALVCLAAVPGWAVDHNNLDEGRPLRLEDAYPIAYGELSVETGGRFSLNRQSADRFSLRRRHPWSSCLSCQSADRFSSPWGGTSTRKRRRLLRLDGRGADRFSFPIEILYGAYWNLHLGLGSTPATEPRTIDEPEKSGDLRVFALYNFNQETLRLPALAAKVSLDFPTGVRSRGVDTELKGIVTRSLGPARAHLNVGYEFLGSTHDEQLGRKFIPFRRRQNVGYEFLGSPNDGKRNGRYEVVVGAQYPLGYPRHFNTTLLADVFTQQAVRSGESNPTGIEVGIRRQLAPLVVVDVGVGTEFAGPAERAPFFATVGVSVGF